MQQYRINYKLLIGLFVGSLVLMVTLWQVWKWQVSRKASWYRDIAVEARENDDLLKAFEYQQKFAKLRKADEEARFELAAIANEVLQLEGVPREDQGMAFSILSETVRRTSDPTSRRNLADLYFKWGQAQQAIVHFEELLKIEDDPELRSLLVRSLFLAKDYESAMTEAYTLIGFDPDTEEFKPGEATVTDQPEIYSTLASVLLSREDEPEVARKIIDEMIAQNSDSAVAHLHKSVFLFSVDEKEEAKEELEKAYQLDPEDSNIIYQRATVALSEEGYEEAISIAEKGITDFPKEMRFYKIQSSAYRSLKQYDEAIKVLDKGIAEFGNNRRAIDLLVEKHEALLTSGDFEGSRKVIGEIENLRMPQLQPLIEFQHAQVTFANSDWSQAALQLSKVRPKLVGFGSYQARAGLMLGTTYEKLGKLDLAREVYNIVLKDQAIANHPLRRSVLARLERIDKRLGLATRTDAGGIDSVVEKMLELPKNQQDWERVDELIKEIVEKSELLPVQELLMRARVMALREKFDEAKDLIREAAKLDPENVSVKLEAARLMVNDPPEGPPKAIRLLQRIESNGDVSFMSRGLLIEAIWASRGEDIKEQLLAQTKGLEDLSKNEQGKILKLLGIKFLQLVDFEQAAGFVQQAIDLDPRDLPLRMQLFDIAYQQRDSDAMSLAQQGILDVVGSEKDGNYVLTEVKRRLVTYKGKAEERRGLEEAVSMLDDALKLRPQWHEIHILYGQLLLTLGRDIELALEHFDDALKYGPPNPRAVALQVKLLFDSGLKKQAIERAQRIPEEYRTQLLGPSEADLLMAQGEMEAAFESAKETAEANQNDAKIQAWYGGIAISMENFDAAAEAFSQAVKLNPKAHDYWMRLIAVHATNKDAVSLEQAFRDAQIALDAELLPLVQAKVYEVQGLWKNAENIYQSMFEDSYEANLYRARQMANFYLTWGKSEAHVTPLAFPFLNMIIRAGNQEELDPRNPNLLWARQQAALYLSSTRDYQDSGKALRIIRQGSVDGSIPDALMPLYLQILASRGDPESLLESIDMLAKLYEQGKLDKSQQLLLARLYERTHRWEQGKDLMLNTLSRYGTDREVWSTYISSLIKQGEYSTAKNRINRFADISKDPILVARLNASLAYEQNDQTGVQRALRSVLPSKSLAGALNDEDLATIRGVAGLAMTYGEYDFAEKLLRLYVTRKNPEGIFDLISVLAYFGNIEEALQYMERAVSAEPMQVARIAMQSLRTRRNELDPAARDRLWKLITTAIDEDPDDPIRAMMRGEGLETLERYDEAITAYEKALDNPDISNQQKAVACNNLSYLLAQTGTRLEDAERFIAEAIKILGPLADILDTRAVIRIARKEYGKAIEDMDLALAIDPTASKYYHLARAQALAGNSEAALDAWEKANENDIAKEELPLLEQPGYEATEQLIKKIRAQ